MKEFSNIWRDEVLILPHVNHRDYWVRFHMLPESKRYPDSEEEYEIILSRHYELLKELGTDSLIVMIPEWYYESDHPEQISSKFNQDSIHWRTIVDEEDPNEPISRDLFVREVNKDDPYVEELLRAVIDDEEGGVIFTPPDFSWLYHPYDGGVDIILRSETERDQLKKKYADWLSDRPDGL